MRELRIELIDPMNEKGVFEANKAKRIDYICVPVFDDGLMLVKVLIEHVIALLSRNGLYPED